MPPIADNIGTDLLVELLASLLLPPVRGLYSMLVRTGIARVVS